MYINCTRVDYRKEIIPINGFAEIAVIARVNFPAQKIFLVAEREEKIKH